MEKIKKCCCNCCPTSFRAKFRPNEASNSMALMPRPPRESEVADTVDGTVLQLAPEILTIKEVDLCLKQNGEEHHTSEYELMNRKEKPCLVVRRGQSFSLEITANRAFNPETDGISFIFSVADSTKPNYGQGTLGIAGLQQKHAIDETNLEWNAWLEDSTQEKIKIRINTPSKCVVSEWKMDIDTKLQSTGNAVSYSLPVGIFILYNPWCLQDQVYLESEEHRQEYVMENTGLIWRGTGNRLRPVPWVYAQFERDILECSLYVMRKVGRCSGKTRSDPVKVTRALSAAVNSPDDDGVVYGNWGTDWGKHTPPTKWVGSMKILQQYYKTKKPVKYGQCWVFSGVLATICRSIGIPCRIVTNYASAHDTQDSLTVDYFVDENGKLMEEMIEDSVWNFHVWNEVWMDRPDLGPEFGGWQAIDATPQELSDEMYRCGPAPVAAVKQGEVLRPYDCSFLFSEVNADKVYWKYSGPTQPLKLMRKDTLGIGKFMSTKAVGKMEREDITSNYKYPEKTEEERLTMLKALRQSENLFSRYYLNEDFNDIKFDFELRDDIKIGQPFTVALLVRNRSYTNDHTVSVILRVETTYYTGKIHDLVKRDEQEKLIKANSVEEIRLNVTFEEYHKKLCDQCFFNIACLATVADTKFEYFAQDDFRVRKPDIKIKLQDASPQEMLVCTADISLENPLPLPLKKGVFYVEGPGIPNQKVIKLKDTIPVGGFAKAQLDFIPPRTGRQTITAKFTSKELEDVDGFTRFTVIPNKEMNNMKNGTNT
ncbi:annulin isoform X2 [Chrysoperla carnea]|nr:annulin isoform X2 [Chrysoperla carnea]